MRFIWKRGRAENRLPQGVPARALSVTVEESSGLVSATTCEPIWRMHRELCPPALGMLTLPGQGWGCLHCPILKLTSTAGSVLSFSPTKSWWSWLRAEDRQPHQLSFQDSLSISGFQVNLDLYTQLLLISNQWSPSYQRSPRQIDIFNSIAILHAMLLPGQSEPVVAVSSPFHSALPIFCWAWLCCWGTDVMLEHSWGVAPSHTSISSSSGLCCFAACSVGSSSAVELNLQFEVVLNWNL